MPQVPESPLGQRPAGPGAAPVAMSQGPASGAIPFEILAEIAAGATARVDLCRVAEPHQRAGQLLAVKRLHPHIAEDPTFVNQFLDEVWMTASLRHPNVVEVAGWGTDEAGSYLAVELVQGVSLQRLMKTIFDTGEAFTERMVVYVGACICRGLAAAHALRAPNGEMLNLVHRDLTPGNVLLGFNGEVKIADFGMAKAKQRLTRTLTGMRKGEPTYMAPEQAHTDTIDARADLFSFGVTLFELFAGRRPWTAKSDIDMVQATLRDPPADLRALRPKIDRELVNVVNRCLEKDPVARFQSAREISDKFDEWLQLHGYQEGNEEALARFVRRNAMRQMRWFERAISGELSTPSVAPPAQPRVPTYTEHTKRPDMRDSMSDVGPPRKPIPAPPAIPGSPSGPLATAGRGVAMRPPERPLVPPRASNAPVDARALRAQSVVQQLKKLAPAPEPPRARKPRVPTLDDADDVTDVELRVATVQQQMVAQHPRIIDMVGDDDETGEEVPTLVQKGDAKVQALRAEARRQAALAAHERLTSKPPYVSPGLIVDEDSDQRITAVKQEARSVGVPVVSIVDHDSELPTEPRGSTFRRVRQADTSETPIATPRGKPGRGAIPPSPDIPQRPYAAVADTKPSAMPAPPSPAVQQAARAQAQPPPPPGFAAPMSPMSPMPPPSDPSRISQHDDVQVIDRNVLRQQVLHSEEGIVAESDRLAIEAVRRNEEARAAQLRAERKAAAAKLAGEAARIAAEAVQLVRSAGIAAAAKRLEEAHAVEQTMQSGRFPAVPAASESRPGGPGTTHSQMTTPFPAGFDASISSDPKLGAPGLGNGAVVAARGAAPSSFPEAPRPSAPFAGFPGVDGARAMAITGAPAPASIPPPPGAAEPRDRASVMPPVPIYDSGNVPMASPPARPSFAPPVPSPLDDAFQAQLKPSILGLPSSMVVGLAVVAVFAVIVLALLLAR
jgi:eukaryotic-like serine/threonine-protein kinase